MLLRRTFLSVVTQPTPKYIQFCLYAWLIHSPLPRCFPFMAAIVDNKWRLTSKIRTIYHPNSLTVPEKVAWWLYKRSRYLPTHSSDVYDLETRVKGAVGSYPLLWGLSYLHCCNQKINHCIELTSAPVSVLPFHRTGLSFRGIGFRTVGLNSVAVTARTSPPPPRNWFDNSVRKPNIAHSTAFVV
jgi:hypothetical protein